MNKGDRTRQISDRLKDLLLDRWFDFYTKHFKKIIVVTTVVLLWLMLLFGWMSARRIREIAVNQFNQQQLVLARQGASQILQNVNTLKRELSMYSRLPFIQYPEAVPIGKGMALAYRSFRDEGVIEVRFIEEKQMLYHVAGMDGYHSQKLDEEGRRDIEWGRLEGNRGKTLLGDTVPVKDADGIERVLLKMSVPVWQVSPEGAQSANNDLFIGLLTFVVDAATLIENATKDIRSGMKGYSWTINHKGIFIYHTERSFIGKSSFKAREERKPDISFSRINEIQKEMIAGGEGMSWYVSGWHLGEEGEIKKLIAYAPVRLTIGETPVVWSVAVIAPVSVVEEALVGIQMRQFFLAGTGIFIALTVTGLFILGMMLRWSSVIKNRVDDKTAALKIRDTQYKSLIDHADDIIFTLDPGGIVLSMNSYGINFFRKPKDDIIEHPLREIFPPESADLLMEIISEVFRTNESRQAACSTVIEGNDSWLSIKFSSLVDEKENVYRVLGIGRDITERKKLEAQMFHTEKLASLGTLAAGVAHEINNPLAVILGFTDILIENTPPDSETYDLLKTIEKQGLNAKRIVENLLSFARYKEHQEEEVDINANIEEVIRVVNNTMKLNKITAIMDMDRDLPRVRCEPREIQQVFFNIINNAIAVMKGGGVITVETRAALDGKKVEIRISDTGTGIRKEHRTQIFDPLFTTKRVGEGTGLGLSVSYGIITKYGGSITFETRTAEESKETGTTFIITLPSVKQLPDNEPCWELTKCPQELRSNCVAYLEKTKPCWESNKMYCKEGSKRCEDCIVYLQKGKPAHNDEQGHAPGIDGGVNQ
jgi:two-component system NtrC family sensor kinase